MTTRLMPGALLAVTDLAMTAAACWVTGYGVNSIVPSPLLSDHPLVGVPGWVRAHVLHAVANHRRAGIVVEGHDVELVRHVADDLTERVHTRSARDGGQVAVEQGVELGA